ncbi:MAG: hypothetical protein GY859_11290 [Desulfobacterales bacterium]|nr:hypothetical protein [Desulfobacterales bacterium]
MFSKTLAMIISVILVSVMGAGVGLAGGDLDDGISSYTEDGVTKYDNLGEPDPNVKYIILKAKTKAAMQNKDGAASKGQTDSANINSVVLGAGGTVNGDIIIIDQSKGDKTQVVDQ